ncbi:hypothetical protein PHMEG_00028375 [Phytophthora megakarya]|uniref:Eukaryotic/viral aspartic protease n=1 Tax=Phytophthora megakarya TaxID=4795 RepID=A0A225V539_9STRA|nr:hypothetical protein PHMEG_00028375 [Phytophthora megakarya]
MVRVSGSSGVRGFHRESQEEVQVKAEQGNEMLSGRETASSTGLRYGTPADNDSRQDLLTKQSKVKAEPYSFIDPDKPTLYLPNDTQVSGSEVGKPRFKTVRKQKIAPDDEEDKDHHGPGWSEEDLKSIYHRKELRDFVDQDPVMRILKLKRIANPKEPVTAPATRASRLDAAMELFRLLKEAGMVPGSFDADALFDLDLNVIQATSRDLFQKLKILVGEVPQSLDPLPLTTTDVCRHIMRQPQKMNPTPLRNHCDRCP